MARALNLVVAEGCISRELNLHRSASQYTLYKSAITSGDRDDSHMWYRKGGLVRTMYS